MKQEFYRTIAAAAVFSMLIIALAGCKNTGENGKASAGTDAGGSGGSNYWGESGDSGEASGAAPVSINYSDFDTLDTWEDSACDIALNGGSAVISGSGAAVEQGEYLMVKITQGGTYVLHGTLANGQISVEAGENQVHLVFNGVDITCETSAPVYLNNGKKTVITLAEGTENRLTDGANYTYAVTETDEETGETTGEPNAALFSKKALTINGSGSLTVDGNFNNGITCKDDLKIMNGAITVTAQNHGIRGKDSVVIKDGVIAVTAAEGDGIKSSEQDNAEKGYVYIEGGTITVQAGDDGVQAMTLLAMSSGNLNITCGKDGFHTDGDIAFTGGSATIRADDDGMHADGTLTVSGGSIDIEKSYEGLEGLTVNISGGKIHLASEDDGLNASNGANTASAGGGRGGFGGPGGGGGGMGYESNCQINISGGYLYVDAGGDGIDSNGDITMTNGTVIVNGPTSDANGALDANGTILVNGGFLVAVGSSGMAEQPDGASAQNAIVTTFSQKQQANTIFSITGSDGSDLLTFAPAKAYSSVTFSSPDIKSGVEYTAASGGSYAGGASSDGLMANGSYSGGAAYGTVTVASILSYIGTSGGFGGGMGGGPGGGFGGRPGR